MADRKAFLAKVNSDVLGTRKAMVAVFRESAQRTIALMQTPVAKGGNMPVKTGFLQASGQAVLNGAPTGLVDNPDPVSGSFAWDAGAAALVIAGAELNDVITFAYTARYAAAQNYGSGGMRGHMFVDLAAQQFPQTVEQVAREAQARIKGRG